MSSPAPVDTYNGVYIAQVQEVTPSEWTACGSAYPVATGMDCTGEHRFYPHQVKYWAYTRRSNRMCDEAISGPPDQACLILEPGWYCYQINPDASAGAWQDWPGCWETRWTAEANPQCP